MTQGEDHELTSHAVLGDRADNWVIGAGHAGGQRTDLEADDLMKLAVVLLNVQGLSETRMGKRDLQVVSTVMTPTQLLLLCC